VALKVEKKPFEPIHKAIMYSFLDLNTIIKNTSKLTRADRRLLVDKQYQHLMD